MDENTAPQISDYDPANEQPMEDTESFVGTDADTPWGEILADIPDDYRSTLDERLQQYTEELVGPYEGYEFLQEAQVDPDTVQYALNMLYTLNNNPRQLYDAIAQYYNFQAEQQAASETPGLISEDQPQEDPRYSELQQQMQTIARVLYEQQTASQEAEEDAALESELQTLHEKYGDFDEDFVLGLALSDVPLEDGVRRFKQLAGGSSGRQQPVVMGSGGGAPATGQVDPSKLTDAGRKSLVIQMLQQANQER